MLLFSTPVYGAGLYVIDYFNPFGGNDLTIEALGQRQPVVGVVFVGSGQFPEEQPVLHGRDQFRR